LQLLATHDKTAAENAFAMKRETCTRRVTLWKHTEQAPPQLLAESRKLKPPTPVPEPKLAKQKTVRVRATKAKKIMPRGVRRAVISITKHEVPLRKARRRFSLGRWIYEYTVYPSCGHPIVMHERALGPLTRKTILCFECLPDSAFNAF
jgi:hypothetical protein